MREKELILIIKSKILFWIFLLNISTVFFYFIFTDKFGYLPYPFVYDKSNTFMDFYNPLWWSIDGGFYQTWHSIYPPINFYILQILTIVFDIKFDLDPFFLRSNYSHIMYLYLFIFFMIPLFLVNTKYWLSFSGKEKVLIYFVYISSLPYLFMLERGNLIILCSFLIGCIIFQKNNFYKCILIAILINLKPYLAIYSIYFLIKKRFEYFLLTFVISIIIYFGFGFVINFDFIDALKNYTYYAQERHFSGRELVSVVPNISIFKNILDIESVGSLLRTYPIYFDIFYYIANFLHYAVLILIIIGFSLLIKHGSKLNDDFIYFYLTIIITHLGTIPGGYSLILYLPFIPTFFMLAYKTTKIKYIFIILMFFILGNYDLFPIYITTGFPQYSFISNEYIQMNSWWIGPSAILRPLANFLLFFLLSLSIYQRKNKIKLSIK